MSKSPKLSRTETTPLGGKITSGGGDSILAGLFRIILNNLKVNSISRWDYLVERFIKDPINGIDQNNKDRASARGNLTKELLKNHLSWKVFIKGLRFLGIGKFQIIIITHHANGTKLEHSSPIINVGDMVFDVLNIEEDTKNE